MVTGLGCEAVARLYLEKKRGVKLTFSHIQRLTHGSLFSDLKLQTMTLTSLSTFTFLLSALHVNG